MGAIISQPERWRHDSATSLVDRFDIRVKFERYVTDGFLDLKF